MQYGSRVNGVLKPVPEELGYTQPGEVFELQMETGGIPDETAAITQLLQLEQNTPDMQILYIETNQQTGTITMQFMDKGPGAIILSGLLTSIPTLLIVGSVIIVGYFLWIVMQPTTTNQWLVIGLTTAGIGLILFMAFQDKLPKPAKIWEKGEKEAKTGVERAAKIEAKSKNLKAAKEGYDEQIKRVEDAKKDFEAKIEKAYTEGTAADIEAVKAKYNPKIEAAEKKIEDLDNKKAAIVDRLAALE